MEEAAPGCFPVGGKKNLKQDLSLKGLACESFLKPQRGIQNLIRPAICLKIRCELVVLVVRVTLVFCFCQKLGLWFDD